MVEKNAEGETQQMGRTQDGGALPANDSNRDTATEGSGGGGRGVGGGLLGVGGASHGKDVGQLVVKQLEYQLAYHTSSIEWYAAEIARCEAEILKFREAQAWHEAYLSDVQADLDAFLTPSPADLADLVE
ncbi:hypothetical protein VB780_05235 [Leptolyngbya sp. CCNP1308]|uniref:hypothetical protein n=1 Tax=Leptolyngbya sp. CCNP1308 TaxID=3110255 RepID=UPI002B1EFD6F|nr:hypothetical protein [Leptolyngbya sp. CCNP1308]MEA5447962.1 hypothetical protein [Leptolyngbya sp. CCNP1308]